MSIRRTGKKYWKWLHSHKTWPTEIANRFWSHVAKAGPDECWLWRASGDRRYGNFSVGPRASCRQFSPHVFSYMLANDHMKSPVSRDGSSVVAHSCNDDRCVNPRHLQLETQKENIAYRDLCQNTAKGSKHGRSTLSEDQVVSAVEAARKGSSPADIASDLGCGVRAIEHILNGTSWSWLTGIGKAA